LNSYRNARWHMALTPSNTWGRYVVPLMSPIRASIEQQMRHMPSQPPDRQGRLLDVGCGNGAFLKIAQTAGWSAQGIDFDPIAVAEARRQGLTVDLGGIDRLAAQAQTYDWITCSHVLEHVHEPQQLLQSLHRLLRPGGTLWLQTPNLESIGHRIYGRDWIGIDPPRHLTLQTLLSLRSALEKVGFQIQFRRLSLFSAMAFYAASHALRTGQENAMTLPRAHVFQLRFLPPAIVQSWSLHRAEFHTAIASR
jgi:SAM-dependent methyltransferase